MEVERKDGSDEVPFPAMGGSWYHQTKSFDAANMRLAESQFEFPMSEVRTAIVYGTETEETRDHESPTRFDFDYYFRNSRESLLRAGGRRLPDHRLRQGEQRKPMVSLEDTVESLVRLVEGDTPATTGSTSTTRSPARSPSSSSRRRSPRSATSSTSTPR